MDIGTAKPKGQWSQVRYAGIRSLFADAKALLVSAVPHWGIDLVDPNEEYNIAPFKLYAEQKIREIISRGHVPVLVGGTGLWMDAIIDNLEIPEVKPDATLRAELEKKSLEALFTEYEKLDPDGALVIDRFNPRRLIRAIEVCRATGQPFSALRRKGEPKYDCLWFGPEVPRDELNRRIDERVGIMIAAGLMDEVRRLKETYGCNAYAMTGIGYRQICRFLDGQQSLRYAIEDIQADTRAYARRQMTWFKRNQRIRWITDSAEAFAEGERFLKT
jgi:tRNA dimethylallyltransferase